jgi:hypothetical protein
VNVIPIILDKKETRNNKSKIFSEFKKGFNCADEVARSNKIVSLLILNPIRFAEIKYRRSVRF